MNGASVQPRRSEESADRRVARALTGLRGSHSQGNGLDMAKALANKASARVASRTRSLVGSAAEEEETAARMPSRGSGMGTKPRAAGWVGPFPADDNRRREERADQPRSRAPPCKRYRLLALFSSRRPLERPPRLGRGNTAKAPHRTHEGWLCAQAASPRAAVLGVHRTRTEHRTQSASLA